MTMLITDNKPTVGRRKAAQEFILELEKSFAEFRDQ